MPNRRSLIAKFAIQLLHVGEPQQDILNIIATKHLWIQIKNNNFKLKSIAFGFGDWVNKAMSKWNVLFLT